MIERFVKLSNIFLVLLMALMFQSCLYTGMSHFTDDDLEWINCYSEGDSAYFISNFYNIDTLVVTETEIHDTYNRLIPHEGHSSTFEATGAYTFNIINDSKAYKDTTRGSMFMKKDYDTDTLIFSANLGYRYAFYVHEFERDSKEFHSILSKFSSVDSIKTNYLIFNEKNSNNSESWLKWSKQENNIATFVFNKKYGLVYYKYDDGEEYIRKFD